MMNAGAIALATVSAGCRTISEPDDRGRPAIVLAAFGTSVAKARQVFDYIDEKARKRYPEHEIRWAFTSDFIIRKLGKQGIVMQRPEEVVAELRDAGFRRVAVQSLHIAPGQEFQELTRTRVHGVEVAVGQPLLASERDMRQAIAAIAAKDPELACAETPVVLAAHGNSHHPEFNRELVQLNSLVRATFPTALVATVEGQPGTSGLAEATRLARSSRRVHFVPFMLVAGDHVMNDVMGEEPEAWKQIVGAASTTCSKSLGYRDEILEVFFAHLDTCLKELE